MALTKPTLLGTGTIANGVDTPFPAHEPGDLLLVFASRNLSSAVSNAQPVPPAAGGTVPAYTQPLNTPSVSNGSTTSQAFAWAWATTSSHTTGTWTNCQRHVFFVVRGADPNNPLGGKSYTNGMNTNMPKFPAVTLRDGTDTSLLFRNVTAYQAATFTLALPAAHTSQYSTGAASAGWMLTATKDNTATAPDAVTTASAVTSCWTGLSVEVVPPYQIGMNVIQAGGWKKVTTPHILQAGAWKTPKKVWALDNGVWKLTWEAPDVYVAPADKVVYLSSTCYVATSGTFNAHVAGDVLVVVAVNNTGTTYPTVPSGWTKAYQTPDTTKPAVIGWKLATASNMTSGTWTGATNIATYVFRMAHTTAPIGSVGTSLTATSEAITPQDTSGRSQIVQSRFQSGGSGSWPTTIPNLTVRNGTVAFANGELYDTRTAPALTWGISGGTPAYRSLVFEVLPPAPVTRSGLYGVTIEQLGGNQVKFTALTSYAADSLNDAFFFRASPLSQNDGYNGRSFTKQFNATVGTQTATLEDMWGGPDKVLKTITFNFIVSPTASAPVDVIPAADPAVADPVADPAVLEAPPVKAVKSSGYYHTVDSPYYEQTSSAITFATEEEAQAAGYTKYVKP